jgi:hypothetical protein
VTVKNLGAILLRKNSSIGVINYALYIGTTVGVPASNSEDAGHCGRTLCPLLATTQHLPPRLRLEDVSSIYYLLFTTNTVLAQLASYQTAGSRSCCSYNSCWTPPRLEDVIFVVLSLMAKYVNILYNLLFSLTSLTLTVLLSLVIGRFSSVPLRTE